MNVPNFFAGPNEDLKNLAEQQIKDISVLLHEISLDMGSKSHTLDDIRKLEAYRIALKLVVDNLKHASWILYMGSLEDGCHNCHFLCKDAATSDPKCTHENNPDGKRRETYTCYDWEPIMQTCSLD